MAKRETNTTIKTEKELKEEFNSRGQIHHKLGHTKLPRIQTVVQSGTSALNIRIQIKCLPGSNNGSVISWSGSKGGNKSDVKI